MIIDFHARRMVEGSMAEVGADGRTEAHRTNVVEGVEGDRNKRV